MPKRPPLGADGWPRVLRILNQLEDGGFDVVQECVGEEELDEWRSRCPIHPTSGGTCLTIVPDVVGRASISCEFGCSVADIARSALFDPADVVPALQIELDRSSDTASLPVAIRAIDVVESPPIECIVDEVVPAGEITLFAGDGGSFKSTSNYHCAGAVAGGYAAFNRFATRPRTALILDAENSEGVIVNRLEAIVHGHGWERERVLSNVHILASHDLNLWSPDWQAHLLRLAGQLDAGYIGLDPWAELIQGEENSNSDARPVIKFLRRLASATNAAVVVSAHAAKTRPDQRAVDRVRGASALRDAARSVLFFDDRAEGIAIEHLKMSRSERLAPFVVTRAIESAPVNRSIWQSARFTYQTADAAVLSRAESFVLDQITADPGALNSSDLRTAGKAERLRNEDIAAALSSLQVAGRISFIQGPRNARLWAPASLPTDLGKLDSEPAHPAQTTVGKLAGVGADPAHLAHPYRVGRQGGAGLSAGQADAEDSVARMRI